MKWLKISMCLPLRTSSGNVPKALEVELKNFSDEGQGFEVPHTSSLARSSESSLDSARRAFKSNAARRVSHCLFKPAGTSVEKATFLKYVSLGVMLLGYTVEQVGMKRAATAAYYPAAITLLTAVLGVTVYPFIVFGAVATGRVTRSQVILPLKDMWKPCIIGVAFTLHHLFQNVSAGKKSVPGIWVVVLSKSVVPMSMLLNMLPFTMALRYGLTHWLAVLLLFSGVVLTVKEDLFKEASKLNGRAFNIFLIVLAQLPLAAAFTFIEVSLKGAMEDFFTVALWMWICIFQAVVSWMVSPLSAALSHKSSHSVKADSHLVSGMVCYVLGQTPEDAKHGTDCATASTSWWITIIFTFAMNIAMPVSTRYGGAALMWFVRAMSIPLTGLLFTSSYLMGSYATHLTILQVCGLAVVFGGVVLFNSQEASPQKSCG